MLEDALKTGSAHPTRDLATAIRVLAMDAVEAANSGHPGMPMGMADVATVLFTRFMKFDPADPHWPDRDRFVLSAGHGSMLLYALLYLTGYPDMTLDELKRFRQLGAKTAGHPEYGHATGIETTTGPLGQGLATAVGMAIAERMMNARYGDALVDHHIYAVAGDGCLMEGISHEAIDLAGHLRLSRLIVLWDDNSISIDGPTSLATTMDQGARFAAAGWHVARVDGHDPEAVAAAIQAAKQSDRPSLIACKTVIGYGAPNKKGTEAAHGAPLGAEEVAGARLTFGWSHAPFDIPEPILSAWREVGRRGADRSAGWRKRLAAQPDATRQAFAEADSGAVTEGGAERLNSLKAEWLASKPKLATRQASQKVLDAITPAMPRLIGGSADLTHSNLTRGKGQKPITAEDFSGSYVHYGVREHGMAAAMNGIALHGGFVPYGGTFLVFTDYCRPAIRLSALMGAHVVYVMTHDSIGLGEDGPTHQPVEHLAALRAIPGLRVFRPGDAVETAEAWEVALAAKGTPSVLCLTRQAIPPLERSGEENLTARGAWLVHEPEGRRDVTLLATGSEVQLALGAAKVLAESGVGAAVVSMPCWELFREQPKEYRRAVLGETPRVGVEAAIRFGWDEWLGTDGAFVGMTGFGASGPAPQLYEHFGITTDAVVGAARRALG
jgi:transketolase